MDESTQQIKEYLAKLPKPLQDAVLSPDWHKRLGEIGQKYSLHLDQVSSLEYEVLFVMIGMEPEEDLVENIERELAVSKILAEQLAGDINTRIFQYILKSLEEKPSERPARFAVSTPTMGDTIQNTKEPEQKIDTDTNELKSEIKTVPPPVNLPTDEESPNNSKSDATETKAPILTQIPLQNHINTASTEIKPQTPLTIPVPIIKPIEVATPNTSIAPEKHISLADTKLNTIVKSEIENQPKTVVPPLQTPVNYSSGDPYREPIE